MLSVACLLAVKQHLTAALELGEPILGYAQVRFRPPSIRTS